jgi:hypothetical protein
VAVGVVQIRHMETKPAQSTRDAADRSSLIEKYRTGPDALEQAVAGLADADLDRRPGPDDWTAREVIHHLADAETRAAIRLRQLLAEDDAVIQGYDEEQYARALHYDRRSVPVSLATIRAVRASTAELLDLIDEADFARTGTHSESGAYTVETWLELYAAHCHDHIGQLVAATRG